MTAQTATAAPATATASQLKKAARKDFTRRGQLLTRIEQANAILGIKQLTPYYFNQESEVELTRRDGTSIRGWWVGINRLLVQLSVESNGEGSRWARIGQLTTASLAEVEKVLTALAERF